MQKVGIFYIGGIATKIVTASHYADIWHVYLV